jgi:septum formation protein
VAARHPDAWVLGADTTVFVDGAVLNKPADLDDARRMLGLLSGRTHDVFTGLAWRRLDRGVSEDIGIGSRVTFRRLDAAAIEKYLAAAHVLDKAGAYGIQDHGDLIVERWEGSLTNIIGLPVETTEELLTRHGFQACSGGGQVAPVPIR